MSEVKYFIELTVRFRDLDAMAHVNNSVYLTYFEEARTGYLRDVAKLKLDLNSPVSLIVGEILCRYRSPALYNEQLRIYCRAGEFGRASFKIFYEVKSVIDNRLIAEGYSTLIAYNYQEKKSCSISDEFRERVLTYEQSVPGNGAL